MNQLTRPPTHSSTKSTVAISDESADNNAYSPADKSVVANSDDAADDNAYSPGYESADETTYLARLRISHHDLNQPPANNAYSSANDIQNYSPTLPNHLRDCWQMNRHDYQRKSILAR
jgi:hypothetical protein